jgi:galactofuranosylgalactofuranosylrhamnosyl-N-acetylglucosaminyl-diphospho-decaprenol beta-1,5/1,6-galactofuranosyltransferase
LELFKIKTNGPMEGTSELYIKVLKGNFDKLTGTMECGTVISLDTYFNIFSTSKYSKWTTVTSVTVELKTEGWFKYELFLRRKDEKDRLISMTEDYGPVSISFDILKKDGSYSHYLKLTALEDRCVLRGGRYVADAKPSQVKTAVIICTYKREEYVQKNVLALCSELLDNTNSTVNDALEIFVIDNGQSLSGLLPEHPLVKLIPNKNCGGSGGFTRGLIEALKRKDEITHVLLMDDDVVIDTNAIEKTIQFLKVLRPEYSDLHIAGGMLDMDRPVIQHEATACWDGNIHPNNTGLDLTDPQALLENETEKKADYAAWWYLCFHLNLVNQDSLPMPFFIKGDDIEYGLRNMRHVLVINGVGVWHEGFVGKERPYLDYYIIRNYMVINAIYGIKSRTSVTMSVLFKRMMRAVIFDAPEIVEYVSKAVMDYLSGPGLFQKIDQERLNAELRGQRQRIIENKAWSKKQKIILLLRKLFTCKFWQTLIKFLRYACLFQKNNKKVSAMYQSSWDEIMNLNSWKRILKIN